MPRFKPDQRRWRKIGLFVVLYVPLAALLYFFSLRLLSSPLPESASPKLQCVSYAPFVGKEGPGDFITGLKIPRARVAADLDLLSRHFDCLRVYSMTGLEYLPDLARERGLKLLMGAWINNDEKNSMKELKLTTALAKSHPDVARAVVVGNETLLRGEINSEKLAQYIQWAKKEVGDIPVTYADVWEFWITHPELAPAVDFITIHILPYWEDEPVAVKNALNHVKAIRAKVERKFPDKKILIGETGWPARGKPRWGAVPSLQNQSRYLQDFIAEAKKSGWDYNLIEAFDQNWKAYQEGTVGGSWGLFSAHRRDKLVIDGRAPSFEDAPAIFLLALIAAGTVFLLFLLAVPRLTRVQWARMGLISALCGGLWGYAGFSAFMSISLWGDKTYLFWWVCLQALSAVLLAKTAALGQKPRVLSWDMDYIGRRKINRDDFLATVLFIGTVSFLFYETASQVWLGRYRDYFGCGFLLPVAASCLCRKKGRDFVWEKAVMAITLILALWMAGMERFGNAEVVLWFLVVLFMSLDVLAAPGSVKPLFKGRIRQSLLITLLVLVWASLVRYYFLEWRPLTVQCLAVTRPQWCRGQSVVGFLIHTALLILSGWSLILLGLKKSRAVYCTGAMACFTGAAVLYGVRGAGVGFLVAFFFLVKIKWNQPLRKGR